MPDSRPVWLTDADMATPLDSAFREVVRAKLKAAPADPAALIPAGRCHAAMLQFLKALGCPASDHATPGDDRA